MAINPATPVRSVNSGEIDPDAHSRVDIKQYYAGAAAMKNVEPVPQSGFRLMGGSLNIGEWRGPLSAISISGATLYPGPYTGLNLVWQGTISATLSVVEVTGLVLSAGTGTFVVEANIGGSWVAIAPAFSCGTTAVTRTAALPPQTGQAATAVRIRLTFGVSATVAIASVTAWSEGAAMADPRFATLTSDDGTNYVCAISDQMFDAFTDEGHAGALRLPLTTAAMLPDLDFYAEADTIGVFHPSTVPTQRIRRIGASHEWALDAWPYEGIPEVDLGGTYTKTDDKWQFSIRWAADVKVYLSVTVNGETTPAIPMTNDVGTVVTTNSGLADWGVFAANVVTALLALPSLGTGISYVDVVGEGQSVLFTIVFGGENSGQEFEVSAVVTNTAEASVLQYQTQIGKTEGEALFSATRGYPGTVELAQDRQGYGRIPAKRGATLFSATAEYFNVNITALADSSARLDNIRSQISETVLHIKESKYILAFTNRAVYFATNRVISRNDPLNYVKTSETGIRANTKAIDLDGLVYYASANGEQLISLAYDDVSTSYTANPETLLASHLISGVKRTTRQIAEQQQDAAKIWILREDGRLIAGQTIRNQEIIGFCEWRLADNGSAREIIVDGANRLWLATQRGSKRFIELYDQACLYQAAIKSTADMAGSVAGLDELEGRTVWAQAQGYILGPYTVAGGAIDLEDAYSGDVTVGLWIAPVFESMPQPLIVPQDEVIFRPGRIHTAHINVIETTSIAVGANGTPAVNVALTRAGDPVDAPPPERTELVSVYGMLGSQTGPRLTITQTRPGKLRVRDLALEAKL
jgi:hypothetical protein